ncbi:energy-coupling factor ABC transporter ATP-binding protein [Pleurocapsales cyanobacterium LEGE 06147]|nr:energy-coupling factor ABC transporter ATP-binding protein [Pleurocapsales cyanobacterium LEGE 06147]
MLCLDNLIYHPPATPTPILKKINLELACQELGLIVGPSGSGKTTLLEILAGLAERTGGNIYWHTQELTSLHLQQLGGIVFQFPERHFCGSTILEELRLGHPELGTTRVKEALAEVGLDHVAFNTSPHALSGGQQRRLALAVQLIRQPNILMLDEPTAGLDWSMRRQLTKLLAKLKEHWTLLIVTHDAGELTQIADRCWSIDRGELKFVEPNSLSHSKLTIDNEDNGAE